MGGSDTGFSISLVLIAALAWLGYQTLVVNPANNLEEQKNTQRLLLSTCLSTAENTYHENWVDACRGKYNVCMEVGYTDPQTVCGNKYDPDPNSKWNCLLDNEESNRFDSTENQDKQNCFSEYPQS